MLDEQAEHHSAGGIESIDVMQAKLTRDQFLGFLLGNVLKYALRANFKNQWKADIRKLAIYAGRLNDEVNGKDKRTEETERQRDSVVDPKTIEQTWVENKTPGKHPKDKTG
jgi:hypothetical protein